MLKIACLRTTCDARRFDQIRNDWVRESSDEKSVVERAAEGVLTWFGHMNRISEKSLTKRVCMLQVKGT